MTHHVRLDERDDIITKTAISADRVVVSKEELVEHTYKGRAYLSLSSDLFERDRPTIEDARNRTRQSLYQRDTPEGAGSRHGQFFSLFIFHKRTKKDTYTEKNAQQTIKRNHLENKRTSTVSDEHLQD